MIISPLSSSGRSSAGDNLLTTLPSPTRREGDEGEEGRRRIKGGSVDLLNGRETAGAGEGPGGLEIISLLEREERWQGASVLSQQERRR